MVRQFGSSMRRTIAEAIQRFVQNAPSDAAYAVRFNRANKRWRLPYDLDYNHELESFIVSSDGLSYLVPRRSRIRFVNDGIAYRRQELIYQYMLDCVSFSPGDVILDVGANIGEVSMLLSDLFDASPVAVEPELREFRALKQNLSSRRSFVSNALLWSHETEVLFHSANETGDSSVFEVAGATAVNPRKTTTLDAVLEKTPFAESPIRLLKLEAEGAEPEILLGATNTLARTEFVTADLGPERGPNHTTTLIPVLKYLESVGFEPIDFRSPRAVMLFKRRI